MRRNKPTWKDPCWSAECPDRSEEPPDAALGAQGNEAVTSCRSALPKRLPLRGHLSGPRHRRCSRAANRQYRGHAASSQRDQQARRPQGPCCCDHGQIEHSAGWHTTGKLVMPKNLTVRPCARTNGALAASLLLPSKSPELNPVENTWQYLRANHLSNRVFETYDAIIDASCDAWNALMAKPDAIHSIGMRKWAHMG